MANLLSREKVEPQTRNPEAFRICEELLKAFGLVEDVEKNTLLFRIAKDVVDIAEKEKVRAKKKLVAVV